MKQDAVPIHPVLLKPRDIEVRLDQLPDLLLRFLQAADIGPSQWFYVQALYALLKWYRPVAGSPLPVAGVPRRPTVP